MSSAFVNAVTPSWVYHTPRQVPYSIIDLYFMSLNRKEYGVGWVWRWFKSKRRWGKGMNMIRIQSMKFSHN